MNICGGTTCEVLSEKNSARLKSSDDPRNIFTHFSLTGFLWQAPDGHTMSPLCLLGCFYIKKCIIQTFNFSEIFQAKYIKCKKLFYCTTLVL